MRRLTLLISLLCLVLEAVGQSWTVSDPYAYNDETVVYATLLSNVSEDPMTDFIVGAFIDEECRGEATQPTTGADGSQFFILRVHGDQQDDLGKPITFRVFHKPMMMTYDLISSDDIRYTGGSVGTPSHRITLTLERQTTPVGPTTSLMRVALRTATGKTTPPTTRTTLFNSIPSSTMAYVSCKERVDGQLTFHSSTPPDCPSCNCATIFRALVLTGRKLTEL